MEIFGYYFSWELLTTLLLLVIDTIVFFVSIFRKKVNICDAAKEFILEHLPTCVVLSENINKSGPEKKKNCVFMMMDLLEKAGYPAAVRYQKFIEEQIESILCTPQKKGVDYGLSQKSK